ncbi:MAG: hypothetical protein V4516_03010 [Pseudomonadota bacterium]
MDVVFVQEKRRGGGREGATLWLAVVSDAVARRGIAGGADMASRKPGSVLTI